MACVGWIPRVSDIVDPKSNVITYRYIRYNFIVTVITDLRRII